MKIVIPGTPIVKKNNEHVSFYTKDKYGRKRLRDFPVYYPTDAYKEWSKTAIQACANFKNTHTDITFPLTGKYNLKCLFYIDVDRVIDLSNMYEGPQDILAGNCASWKKSVPSHLYQIIQDDSIRFIGSHDGSRVILDYSNPRTELYLTEFIL